MGKGKPIGIFFQISRLELFQVSSADMAESSKKKTSASMMMPDWTKLPEELLQVISENLENWFDVIHARSVCSSWRSAMPFPCSLLRPRYSLPIYPIEKVGLCSLEKFPLVLFRVPADTVDADGDAASASEYFMGGIGRRDESEEDHMEELPTPIQCSVKVKIGESDPTLLNVVDCQILSLGHQYRLLNWNPDGVKATLTKVAFLPLNKESVGEFVVLLNWKGVLLVLTSAQMKWKLLEKVPNGLCRDLVTFRGRFYASYFKGTRSVVIDPYSLDVTDLLMPSSLHQVLTHSLVPFGNDEIFLVEEIVFNRGLACRVSRLDEEAGKWVEVSHLGNRVLFINRRHLGNVCCSAKELPEGCGVSGNSIVFSHEAVGETFFYKYHEHNRWILSREKRVKILSKYPVVAFRVNHVSP